MSSKLKCIIVWVAGVSRLTGHSSVFPGPMSGEDCGHVTWSPPIGGHLEQECAGRGGEVARPLEDGGLQLAAAQHGTEQPGLHTVMLSYLDTCQIVIQGVFFSLDSVGGL